MKTKETSTRQQAGKWFASKSYLEQHELSDKYFESRNPSLLTIEQIEEIWRKETQRNYGIENSLNQRFDEMSLYTKEAFEAAKPNQKQFKQFDEELFKAYISKFSENDRYEMLRVLSESFQLNFCFENSFTRISNTVLE